MPSKHEMLISISHDMSWNFFNGILGACTPTTNLFFRSFTNTTSTSQLFQKQGFPLTNLSTSQTFKSMATAVLTTTVARYSWYETQYPPRNTAFIRLTFSLITSPLPSSLLASNSPHPRWQSRQFIFPRIQTSTSKLWRATQPPPPNRHSYRRLQRHITCVGQFKLQRSRYLSWRRHLWFSWFHLI